MHQRLRQLRPTPRLTNDGNAILRGIDVAHSAAKNMIKLSRTQDEECGDSTTSVIIFEAQSSPSSSLFFFFFLTTSTPPTRPYTAGDILAQTLSQLERDINPVVIISAYNKGASLLLPYACASLRVHFHS
ncbi:hypothetical protein CVT25_010084 [Psilocybe cyanescens]|uniref:Uncharacterized protein n=1 Tax=Psilocybe cyanescens TaxID=93625 RepID=A0A409XP12_PSICY|nr:hypothetical protein CVT25_010084 [Psilocybe cyanescens]